MCEEFDCTPLEALRQPAGLTLAILELRAFARAKEVMDRPKGDEEATGWQRRVIMETLITIKRMREGDGD